MPAIPSGSLKIWIKQLEPTRAASPEKSTGPDKGDCRLYLWEKYQGTPEAKEAIVFVHGSSMASTPTFDLSVPGRPYSSVMNWFALQGFDTWCLDMEGYGRSDKDRDDHFNIANGADDLRAATN